MGCLGRHLALTDEQVAHLRRVGDWENATDEELEDIDERLWEAVQEIEERLPPRYYFDTDKAWDNIHRVLTLDNTANGMVSPSAGTRPLNLVVFGGEDLCLDDDNPPYAIYLIEPDEVAEVASALQAIDEEWFRKRFFSLDPPRCDYDIDEDELRYAWSNFRGLPDFFARAAAEGRAVLFTVSF
jgi:hypothetical protein